MAGHLQWAAAAPLFALKGLIRVSFRAASIPVRLVTIPFRFTWDKESEAGRSPANLPIAGLAGDGQRRVEFALRNAVQKDEDEELVELWSEMMSLIQAAAENILEEFDQATLDLTFWQQRAAAKNRSIFLLLGRGPKQFCLGIGRVFLPQLRRKQLRAADEMEQRVVVLQASQARLAQALARVHRAAGAMRVVQRAQKELKRRREASSDDQTSSELGGRDVLLQITRDGLSRASEGLTEAVASLRADAKCHDGRTSLQMMGITTSHPVPRRRSRSRNKRARSAAATSSAGEVPKKTGLRLVTSYRLSLESREDSLDAPDAEGASPLRPTGDETVFPSQAETDESAPGLAPLSKEGKQTQEPPPAALKEAVEEAKSAPGLVSIEDLREGVRRAKQALQPGAGPAQDIGLDGVGMEPSNSAPFADTDLGAAPPDQVGDGKLNAEGEPPKLPNQHQQPEKQKGKTSPEAKRRGYPFGIVPPWARRPSILVQNWLSVSANIIAGCLLTRWVYKKHKDGKLKSWALEGRRRGSLAYKDKIVRPLQAVSDHIFETFQRPPAIVDREDVRQSRESLRRMLETFAADVGENSSVGLADGPAAQQNAVSTEVALQDTEEMSLMVGMEIMMRKYEEEMRSPWRSALLGHLPQALLIQVQKLKVETETALLQLDQILHANELTMSVIAALPALGLTLAMTSSLLRLLFRGEGEGRAGRRAIAAAAADAASLRMAMLDVERTLDKLCATAPAAVAAFGLAEGTVPVEADGMEQQSAGDEDSGYFLYRLHVLYRAAHKVLVAPSSQASSAMTIEASSGHALAVLSAGGGSEWRNFHSDLLELVAPVTSPQQKRVLAARMWRVYACLQPGV